MGILRIEEHLTEGTVTKRIINGVEYPVDAPFPERLRVLEFEEIRLTQIMSYSDAQELYGECFGSVGTSE